MLFHTFITLQTLLFYTSDPAREIAQDPYPQEIVRDLGPQTLPHCGIPPESHWCHGTCPSLAALRDPEPSPVMPQDPESSPTMPLDPESSPCPPARTLPCMQPPGDRYLVIIALRPLGFYNIDHFYQSYAFCHIIAPWKGKSVSGENINSNR